MKKFLTIIIILLMFLVTLRMAVAQVGDPEIGIYREHISWWDKYVTMGLFGNDYTVLGGGTCSVEPDISFEAKPICSGDNCQICYQKPSGKTGLVIQLFNPTTYDYIKQSTSTSSQVCVSGTANTLYHVDVYLCGGGTERKCVDGDGGRDIYKSSSVTVTVDGQSNTYYDKCYGNKLQELSCDSQNSLTSYGFVCVDTNNKPTLCIGGDRGACSKTQYVTQPLTASISGLKDISVIEGDSYTVTGTIKVGGECVGCVVETGVQEYGTQFSTITSSYTGACGDDKTVGAKFNLKDNSASFALKDKANVDAGNYRVNVYVTSGCGQGKILDTESFVLTVKAEEETPEEPETPTKPGQELDGYGCLIDSQEWCSSLQSCVAIGSDCVDDNVPEIVPPTCDNTENSEGCDVPTDCLTCGNVCPSSCNTIPTELPWYEKFWNWVLSFFQK